MFRKKESVAEMFAGNKNSPEVCYKISLKDHLFPNAIISPDTLASLDYFSYYIKSSIPIFLS